MSSGGKTSSEILKYITSVHIEEKLIPMAMRLLEYGESPKDTKYFRKHPTIPNAHVVMVKMITPVNMKGIKGRVWISDDKEEVEPPSMKKEMMNYDVRFYQGKKMYVDPEHMKYIKGLEFAEDQYITKMGFILIRGKGVITFVPDGLVRKKVESSK